MTFSLALASGLYKNPKIYLCKSLSPPPGGGGSSLYGFSGDVRPDRVWISAFFVLNGVSFSLRFFVNRVSLHLNGKSVHLKFAKIVQKAGFRTYFVGADASSLRYNKAR